jgi:CPA2 family monovalent cation:H+ antiporter-2
MSELPELVKDLALILVVASIVTLLFKKLKQPLVLGYIVAGFLVSPHMPYTMSVVDRADIQTWADIGVIFLLFSLGLDFSFKKIMRMGAAPIIAACTIIFSMMMLGISVGHLFGWNRMDCIFLGGMLAMSSTTIIYKAFDDMGLRQQQFASMVMSVLILEDILAIVMMVMLSAIAGGNSPDGGQMAQSVLRIVFFLVLWFVVGIFAIPLFLRKTRQLMSGETLLIVALGFCCLMAVVSTKVGFSSAFGAFVMGSILAETVEADKIIHLVEPVKNLFGAIFFVSVGMLVDPAILVSYAIPILLLILTIIIGQSVFGSLGYLFSGQPLKQAMRCGFSMAQIGEFAFIIASLGLSLGVISDFLYPVVVAVSVITTFLTPYMMRAADPAYNYLEKRMPRKWIRRLNHLYEGVGASSKSEERHTLNLWRSLLRAMLMNTVIYGILSSAVIALMFTFVLPVLRRMLPGWELHWYANAICGMLTVLFISPFLRSIVVKKNHSEEFRTLWTEKRLNRLPLLFTVVVRVIIAASFIFYIVNYLSRFRNAIICAIALVAVVLMIMSRSLKHRSIRLERLFIMNLRSREIEAQVSGRKRPLYEGHLLDRSIHIADVEVPENSRWVGQQLSQLRIGSRFGVHVSSILRGGRRINIPGGNHVVFPGDRMSVIGSDEQLSSFSQVLASELYADDPNLEQREMQLRQITIGKNSQFVGKTLSDSRLREDYGCMVVGVEAGQRHLTIIPANYHFVPGDVIWVVGEESSLRRLIEN